MKWARTSEALDKPNLGRPRRKIENRPEVCPSGHKGSVILWGAREWTTAPFGGLFGHRPGRWSARPWVHPVPGHPPLARWAASPMSTGRTGGKRRYAGPVFGAARCDKTAERPGPGGPSRLNSR